MKQAELPPLEGAGAFRIWANLLTANNRLCGRHNWGMKIAGECKCRERQREGRWTLEKKPEACCTNLVLKEHGLQSQKILDLNLGFVTYQMDDPGQVT